MNKSGPGADRSRHLGMTEPSAWVRRFAPLVPVPGPVLDLACGGGRHSRHFLGLGYQVVAVDRAVDAVADLAERAEIVAADLEDGSQWPFPGRRFGGVVVVNYLYRPLFPVLLDSLLPGGVLIYETFARSNEAYARPRNPDHLLRPGELLEVAQGVLQVVAFEHGMVERAECPGVIQRLCAVNDLDGGDDPAPHALQLGGVGG
jgi:SAM-dependent methyltransferase